MNFYGRSYELSILEKALKSNRAELGIIYGRRRVGKSTLIRKADIHQHGLYFEGLENVSKAKQIRHFMRRLAEQTNTPEAVANDWDTAFSILTKQIKSGHHYVVFDELSWMASGRTHLISLLKYYWDNHWIANPNLVLILCGSIARFMVKHVIHSRALHNRKTFEFRLEPFFAYEAENYFRGLRSRTEIAQYLMIFGGIPKYLEQIDPKKSLSENLDTLCFMRDGFFVTEFESIFKEQFSSTKIYGEIIEKLASESCSKAQLEKSIGIASGGGVSSYLENLEQADFIKRFHSFSFDSKKPSKTSRYVLWDPWLRFYFRYVRPNEKRIKLNTKPGFFDRVVRKSYPSWCGLQFERLCMANLPSLLEHMHLGVDRILDYGPYFKRGNSASNSSGAQIDLIIQCLGKVLIVAECKWKEDPIGRGLIPEMEHKIKQLQAPREYSIQRTLISRSGTTANLEDADYLHRVIPVDALFKSL